MILVLAVVWSIIVSTVGRACSRWQRAPNFWLLWYWSCNALGSGLGGLWFESRQWHVWILQPYLTFRVVYNMCVYELTWFIHIKLNFLYAHFQKTTSTWILFKIFFPFLINCFDLSWCLFIDLMLNVYLFNNFCERMLKIRKKCDLCTKTNQSKLWYYVQVTDFMNKICFKQKVTILACLKSNNCIIICIIIIFEMIYFTLIKWKLKRHYLWAETKEPI